MRPWLDQIGPLRDVRVDQINQLRTPRLMPKVLKYTPGSIHPDLWSARRINAIASHFPEWKHYLEIGTFLGATLESVNVPLRTGVDPNPLFDVSLPPKRSDIQVTTSDEYFAALPDETRFDIAFVDGLHTSQQTYRDVINTLRRITNGPILIDDTVPCDEYSAIPNHEESLRARAEAGYTDVMWHGDVWRVIWLLNEFHTDLEWRTITDRGNPQTLVWLPSGVSAPVSISDAQIARSLEISYHETFSGGIPDYFKPASEDQAISSFLSARGR